MGQTDPPEKVRLDIHSEEGVKKRFVTFSEAEQTIGRSEDGQMVEIDMTPYDAVGKGVSRRHAVLRWLSDGIYVEDLESTNGTRINGVALHPAKPYLLRNGDEVEFGQLRTTIRFMRQ